MGVENSMISYGGLKMNYYYCPNQSNGTCIIELIMSYC